MGRFCHLLSSKSSWPKHLLSGFVRGQQSKGWKRPIQRARRVALIQQLHQQARIHECDEWAIGIISFDLLVFLIWSMFSHDTKRLTFYFQVLWVSQATVNI